MSKPSDGEYGWNGSQWVRKPSAGEHGWDGSQWVSKPTDWEYGWDGRQWVPRPADNDKVEQWIWNAQHRVWGAKQTKKVRVRTWSWILGLTAAVLLCMAGFGLFLVSSSNAVADRYNETEASLPTEDRLATALAGQVTGSSGSIARDAWLDPPAGAYRPTPAEVRRHVNDDGRIDSWCVEFRDGSGTAHFILAGLSGPSPAEDGPCPSKYQLSYRIP